MQRSSASGNSGNPSCELVVSFVSNLHKPLNPMARVIKIIINYVKSFSSLFFAAPLLSLLSIFVSVVIIGAFYFFVYFLLLLILLCLKPIVKKSLFDKYSDIVFKYLDRVREKSEKFFGDSDMILFIFIVFYIYTLLSFYTSLPRIYNY